MTIASIRTSIILLCAPKQFTEDAKDRLLEKLNDLVGPEKTL